MREFDDRSGHFLSGDHFINSHNLSLDIVWILLGENRPFPSSKKSHFQSEAKYEVIDMKMIFNCDANKTHFHNKGFALSLVLNVRYFGTRKWPIDLGHYWDLKG